MSNDLKLPYWSKSHGNVNWLIANGLGLLMMLLMLTTKQKNKVLNSKIIKSSEGGLVSKVSTLPSLLMR